MKPSAAAAMKTSAATVKAAAAAANAAMKAAAAPAAAIISTPAPAKSSYHHRRPITIGIAVVVIRIWRRVGVSGINRLGVGHDRRRGRRHLDRLLLVGA